MKVTVAQALGTCFGVQDAIDMALDSKYKNDLTIIGQLVHNPQTVERLKANGVKLVDSIQDTIGTGNVMITAHGAPQSLKDRARGMGFQVFDASCPLVERVHVAVRKLVEDGYFPAVIGEAQHVEVRGIVGDLKEYAVIGKKDDLAQLQGKSKVGVVCQTTQQIGYARELVQTLKDRNPGMEVKFVDTICKPTKDRQEAVTELARQVDIMIVVGGFNSSNTKKLKKVCEDMGLISHHVERASEIKPEWFNGHEHVGITAGTSTPADIIQEVYEYIQAL